MTTQSSFNGGEPEEERPNVIVDGGVSPTRYGDLTRKIDENRELTGRKWWWTMKIGVSEDPTKTDEPSYWGNEGVRSCCCIHILRTGKPRSSGVPHDSKGKSMDRPIGVEFPPNSDPTSRHLGFSRKSWENPQISSNSIRFSWFSPLVSRPELGAFHPPI